MTLPSFVIAGAQKCGTSSIAATLRRHPEVFVSKPKELHFFDNRFESGLAWYRDQFHPRATQRAAGEATPSYLYFPEVRRRMVQSLPDARFIVILRDPAKRAYSHYWHSRRLGLEDVDFETALELEPERLSTGVRKDQSRFSYVDRGHYLEQLTDLLGQGVSRERLHVMLLEDLKSERVPTLERLFDFLGIDPTPASTIEEKWTNRYWVPEGPEAKKKYVEYPPIPDRLRERLVEHFWPHNERLAAWLGRDLTAWNKV